MYEERRKHPRLNINIKVNWDKDEVGGLRQRGCSDITKDISEGGVCLIVYDKVDVGHSLRLKIELPTKKVVESRGKVVWVKEFEIIGKSNEKRYDIGVEFSEVNSQDREEMKNFIQALLKNGK